MSGRSLPILLSICVSLVLQTASVGAVLAAASGSTCVLDLEENWEGAAIDGKKWDISRGQGLATGGDNGNLPASIRGVSANQAREGLQSLRIYLNEQTTQFHERAEVALKKPKNFTPNVIYVMGLAVKVRDSDGTSGWASDTVKGVDPRDPPGSSGHSAYDIVGQFHGSGTSNRNPPFSIHAEDGLWKFLILGDSINASGKNFERKATYACGAVVADQWEQFTFRFRFGAPPSGRDGFYEIYRNGSVIPCVSDTGINWFTKDAQGPFFKLGLYKAWGKYPDGPHERTVYHDAYRLGRESEGCNLADVTPR